MAGIHPTDRPCAVCGVEGADCRRVYLRPTPLHGELPLCDRCEYSHPEYQRPRGRICSFDRHQTQAEVLACLECELAKVVERERVQQHETIDPNQDWGAHIALTCVNHPELRWHTKNIGFIGARSIFYAGNPFDGSECKCPGRDLRVV